MKVGTDAMLLGVWADVENVKSILDIGTGCGIIGLLLAARSRAEITAIDIDVDSIAEAQENFKLSPFSDRINAIHIDLNDFSLNPIQLFDLIVSNPPFFINDLRPDDEKRKKARHSDYLTYKQLCEKVYKLLSMKGRFCVVLPYEESRKFVEVAKKNSLFPKKQFVIFPRKGMLPNRVNIEFTKEPANETCSEKFSIRNSKDEFTKQYIDFLKDYYLNLGE
jgi:tRNA1Val (adenine37-N6)-methyltransferase